MLKKLQFLRLKFYGAFFFLFSYKYAIHQKNKH